MGEKISFIDLFGTELEIEDQYAREQLADESAARAEDVAVLEARMDTFTALPAGSTSGDAELMDIRVGADGTTYANAGDAVRGQVFDLNNEINSISDTVYNNIVNETINTDITSQKAYRDYFQFKPVEGKKYKIQVNLNELANGTFSTSSFPVAFAVYLAKGEVAPTSSFVTRTFVNSSAANVGVYTFYFTATATDATSEKLCVHIQLTNPGTYSAEVSAFVGAIGQLQTEMETAETIANDTMYRPYKIGSINQICRLGWNVASMSTPPEQSIASYNLAYSNACRIMLCDVRKTSDGKYICWHDATLNNHVKHADGTALSETELAYAVANLTLSELDSYDFGVYKGSQYAGTKILRLSDFLEWCSIKNCIPVLEVKVQLTEQDCINISNLCKMYGLGNDCIIAEYQDFLSNTINYWCDNLPGGTLGVVCANGYTNAISYAQTAITNGLGAIIIFSSDALVNIQDGSGNIDVTKIQLATSIGVDLSYTELITAADVQSFYDDGYFPFFKYISTRVKLFDWIAENT